MNQVTLGIGCIIGAGIVVLTGLAAHEYAGPGVVLSYAFGAIAAMLTAFCYAGKGMKPHAWMHTRMTAEGERSRRLSAAVVTLNEQSLIRDSPVAQIAQ